VSLAFEEWRPGEPEARLAGISPEEEARINTGNALALRKNNELPPFDMDAAQDRVAKIIEDAGEMSAHAGMIEAI
jgi:hypothetical protein